MVKRINPEIVQKIRRKFAFSEEFISITLHSVEQLGRNRDHAIVLLDLGGKRTAENAELLRRSTHCIILSSQPSEIPAWHTFAVAENCEILAVLHSQLVYCPDDPLNQLDTTARSSLQLTTELIQGTIVNLCRGLGKDCYTEAVGELADALLAKYQHLIQQHAAG